jgi:hypothetical protein
MAPIVHKTGGHEMGTNSNNARASQLGMPFGTAQNKLRKSIMFKYVKMVGHDICFKCGVAIDDLDELSIEHKLPWLGRDTNLFWDLDNIAFSHLRCNRPESGFSDKNRKIGPEGTSWCYYCKSFKLIEEFWKGKKWDGTSDRCRSCNNQSKKDYRVDRKK